MHVDILAYNREAWDNNVEKGNKWTLPVSTQEVAEARKGRFSVLLTPTKPVPMNWFKSMESKKILCLASGGGQQAPLFAAAGAEVTVLDNSPAQLNRDRQVADAEGLSLFLEHGDMRDLSRFKADSFDLIFHPVSNSFVDDVPAVWKECYRVLKKGGVLLAGFTNPLVYIFDFKEWDENGKLAVKYSIPYSDTDQLPSEELHARMAAKETLEFGHSLAVQIGGQLKAGFILTDLYEDSSGGDLLDAHIDTFIATRALKL